MSASLSATRPKRAAAAETAIKINASLKAEAAKPEPEADAQTLKKAKANDAATAKKANTKGAATAKKANTKGAATMNPAPFKLERYFGLHEFSAKVLLSSSDVESLSLKQLLQLSTDASDTASLQLWEDLSLGYTESQGHPEFLAEIAKTYSDAVRPEHVLEVAPEEGILIAMSTCAAARGRRPN